MSFDSQFINSQANIKPSSSPKINQPNNQSSSSGDNSSIERISYGRRSAMSESQNNAQLSRGKQKRKKEVQRSNASSNGESWRAIGSVVKS